MKLVQSKRIFVNSERPPHNSECRDLHLNVLQGVISCNQNQQIRLTLGSFTMRKNFYNVNKYNNTFYIAAKSTSNTISSGKVTIPQGNYQSFTHPSYGLCPAIENAINSTLASTPFSFTGLNPAGVEYNPVTGIITIQISLTGSEALNPAFQNMKLVTFTIRNYSPGSGSIIQDIIGDDVISSYQDNFEIMGGCHESRGVLTGTLEEQYNDLVDMYSVTPEGHTGSTPPSLFTYTGHYQASVSSRESIYLRTDLQSNNVQTAGFDTGFSDYPYIVNSRILAKLRIPNPGSVYSRTGDGVTAGNDNHTQHEVGYETIHYEDNGEYLYSMLLTSNQISNLRLSLTDEYGRLLHEESPEQVKCGAMYFTCSIIVDILENDNHSSCSCK